MQLAQDAAADAVLASEPFVLTVGMLLDQQVPLERAFGGAARLHERLRDDYGGLVPTVVAAMDPDRVAEICAAPPAVHRFPAAMARRIHALAVHVRDVYDGDVTSLWRSADTGRAGCSAARLPGFGRRRRRSSWRCSASSWESSQRAGEKRPGPTVPPAVTGRLPTWLDAASLAQVRAFKQEQKRAKASKA
jgi:uncharacterized HhH-GPD family protein